MIGKDFSFVWFAGKNFLGRSMQLPSLFALEKKGEFPGLEYLSTILQIER